MSDLRVLTLLGTRPEIIRLSRVIPLLDHLLRGDHDQHILVHTGQNHSPDLADNFFSELGLRSWNYHLQATGTVGEQLATIFRDVEKIIEREQPDRFLVLGDTNSSLAAIVAARSGVPVYHMEAGNRSFSPSSPEEVNRRLVDHSSSVLLPYTERARQNLLAEGIHSSRILVTGNPIWEVIEHYRPEWQRSAILNRLKLQDGKFFLVTLHRQENVDRRGRLEDLLDAFDQLASAYGYPVIVSTHPRTRQRIVDLVSDTLSVAGGDNPAVRFLPPFPFFDFLELQSSAFCTLTDSGTVQEESCLLRRPCVVLRDHTERPETVEAGATVLAGADPERILAAVAQVTSSPCAWPIPADYLRLNVADTVARIICSHRGEVAL